MKYMNIFKGANFEDKLELSVILEGLFIASHLASPVIVDAISFAYKTE